ncbi:hypothetical protein [Natrinema amylolyticum]|uniref:hypothetical protein n=1 Tax=Natrinema amylolyticum TaxID=2878679 RepID=UPI001CFC21D4|nr:hypothetical protein [Natrinema amylolyticum]
MNRRPFLQTLATGGIVLSAGCVSSISFSNTGPDADDVFADYRYEGTELVVRFRDDRDVQRVVLFDGVADEEYETVERPSNPVRFPVVFPDRLETYVSQSLRVKAETPDGSAQQRIWGLAHAYVSTVEPLPDGRARLEIENQGDGPLLVRFVAIHGDVPNPTIDPQSDSFDQSSFELGSGVVGVDENRPLSPSRTDLVVQPGETKSFETTYAPFAFLDETAADGCTGDEGTGRIAVVHGSGGSAAYDFAYRLEGSPTKLEGRAAAVCPDLVVEP